MTISKNNSMKAWNTIYDMVTFFMTNDTIKKV